MTRFTTRRILRACVISRINKKVIISLTFSFVFHFFLLKKVPFIIENNSGIFNDIQLITVTKGIYQKVFGQRCRKHFFFFFY